MRITSVDGTLATIAIEGLEQQCSLALLPDAGVGDYVLVHAGFAISVIDETEARETFDLLREIAAFDDADACDEADDDDAAGDPDDPAAAAESGDDAG
jgi:hydrogenase expression/formation protein HypC